MLNRPVIVLVLLGLGAVLAWCLWSAWRYRRVDFIHRVMVGEHGDAVAAQLFDRIVPVLVGDGYRMVAQAGNTTIFEHRTLPAWTVLVSIFFFPFGLLALLARNRETVVVVSSGGMLELHGFCSKVQADYVTAVADDVAGQVAAAF